MLTACFNCSLLACFLSVCFQVCATLQLGEDLNITHISGVSSRKSSNSSYCTLTTYYSVDLCLTLFIHIYIYIKRRFNATRFPGKCFVYVVSLFLRVCSSRRETHTPDSDLTTNAMNGFQ